MILLLLLLRAGLTRCGAQLGTISVGPGSQSMHQGLYLYVLDKQRVDYSLVQGPISLRPAILLLLLLAIIITVMIIN